MWKSLGGAMMLMLRGLEDAVVYYQGSIKDLKIEFHCITQASIGLSCLPFPGSRAGITGIYYQAQLSRAFAIREVAII